MEHPLPKESFRGGHLSALRSNVLLFTIEPAIHTVAERAHFPLKSIENYQRRFSLQRFQDFPYNEALIGVVALHYKVTTHGNPKVVL
ncbi:MAG: hypothetical protein IPI48_13440 [bacterium]|nr:hypothetical protein [bacterium]